ncbi:hypothetical protein [Adhaeribacter arboris]|nr:hypothetical protein [Adhaeribacter arboris]
MTTQISCKSKKQKKTKEKIVSQQGIKPESSNNSIQEVGSKEVSLSNGLRIKASEEEDFGDFKTYTQIDILHNNQVIYSDSTQEYEFGNKLFPILNQINPTAFEILLEVNDRPSKNKLKYLQIQGNKVTKEMEMPTFIAEAANLDEDNILESAGFWDYPQMEESGKSVTTAYNPILYYEWTKNGLRLDSTLTIKKNTQIYGTFHGFNFREEVQIPVKQAELLTKEIEKIERK